MSDTEPTLAELFTQLGLADDELSIARFICNHPLDANTLLPEAPFWDQQQADFLREALWDDSPWSQPIDELDRRLRQLD